MENKYWYCVCIRDDCNATFLGPFPTKEMAKLEGADPCQHAHLTWWGIPDAASYIAHPQQAETLYFALPNVHLLDQERIAHNVFARGMYEPRQIRNRDLRLRSISYTELAFPDLETSLT